MENKQLICNKMLDLLQATRQFHDLTSLTYVYNWDEDRQEHVNSKLPTEYVMATFRNNYKKFINVSADSGYAMIKDVLKNL